MAKDTVLIITHSGDLHADRIAPLFAERRFDCFRLDLDAFPRDYQICQHFSGASLRGEIHHIPSGARLALERVGAVWNRKPGDFAYRCEDMTRQERAYAQQETEQALFGLLYTLDCYWMSHPAKLRAAQWKGEQLQRAMCMGFRVPASIVTNSPQQVREFQASLSGALIFKSLSSPLLGADLVADEDRVSDGLGIPSSPTR